MTDGRALKAGLSTSHRKGLPLPPLPPSSAMVSICHTPSPRSGGWRNMWTAPYGINMIVNTQFHNWSKHFKLSLYFCHWSLTKSHGEQPKAQNQKPKNQNQKDSHYWSSHLSKLNFRSRWVVLLFPAFCLPNDNDDYKDNNYCYENLCFEDDNERTLNVVWISHLWWSTSRVLEWTLSSPSSLKITSFKF